MISRLLLILSIAGSIQRSLETLFLEKRSMPENREICNTKECAERVQEILTYLDQTVDPCEDFYSFACGKHIKAVARKPWSTHSVGDRLTAGTYNETIEVLTGLPNVTQPTNATQTIIWMYQNCMYNNVSEKDEVDAVASILQKDGFGEWPLPLNQTTDRKKFRTIEDIVLTAGHHGLFGVIVYDDGRASNSSIIAVAAAVLNIPQYLSWRFESRSGNDDTTEAQVQKKVLLEAARKIWPEVPIDRLNELANRATQFLDEFQKSGAVQTDLFWRKTIKEVQDAIPSFPFLKIINEVFKKINATFTNDDVIMVIQPQAFNNTLQYVLRQDLDAVYNYIFMFAAGHLLRASSVAFDQHVQRIYEEHKIKVTQKTKTDFCMNIFSVAKQLLTRLYILNKFDMETKIAVRSILNHVGERYYNNLQFLPWMDRSTRREAIHKLWNMVPVVGVSDDVMNATITELQFGNLGHIPKNAPLATMLHFLVTRQRENNLALIKRGKLYLWEYQYEKPNAFYGFLQNKIIIQAGILQDMFYKKEVPMYLNLGSIGNVLAHEITHGFDVEGSKLDSYGRQVNWWSNYTRTEFNDKAQCFVGQYGKIVDKVTNMSVNGERTLSENIADNGAIRGAFKAFRSMEYNTPQVALPGLENFTSEQLFFISFAIPFCTTEDERRVRSSILWDNHAPHRYRVNVVLQNMEEFSAAFQCKKGSAMRLSDGERCALW